MTPEEKAVRLKALAGHLRSSAAILDQFADDYTGDTVTPPEPEPEPETPPVVPVPTAPIWDLLNLQVLTIPREVVVPSGAAEIFIPVTVDACDRNSFMAYVDRLVNVSGGGINTGTAAQQRENFAGLGVVYHWSPGDDPLHWVKITPRNRYRDGQAFAVNIRVKGLGDNQKGRGVTVRFADDAPVQEITQPFHRPLRTLGLGQARRKNTFDPRTLLHNPTGAGGAWMTALSHGRSQDGNQETGLYADSSIPGAVNPISYDATEEAIRLHSLGYATPVVFGENTDGTDRRFNYQAAVLHGLHNDDVCGAEGVWRMEGKIPTRRYSWPAFWLVNRSKNSRGEAYSQWPGEIDILEKFNQVFGEADTPYTSSFAQHFGRINEWQNKRGAFGNDFDVDQYGSPRIPLDEVYTSWAVHVEYDPVDTTKSEVTFFVNDREVGCHILFARHQDLNRKIEFYPIFNVAVKTPQNYTPERYNSDDGRGKSGDMFVRDVAYFPKDSGYTIQ